MAEKKAEPSGPDLAHGIALSMFTSETLLGHVGDQDVLLVRSGPEIFAIDARCSHYHGPLAEGLVVGDSIRCPGTTPVSICGPAKQPARRRSPRSRSGKSTTRAIAS
jgi:Rieske [2Fe-2S] domain